MAQGRQTHLLLKGLLALFLLHLVPPLDLGQAALALPLQKGQFLLVPVITISQCLSGAPISLWHRKAVCKSSNEVANH